MKSGAFPPDFFQMNGAMPYFKVDTPSAPMMQELQFINQSYQSQEHNNQYSNIQGNLSNPFYDSVPSEIPINLPPKLNSRNHSRQSKQNESTVKLPQLKRKGSIVSNKIPPNIPLSINSDPQYLNIKINNQQKREILANFIKENE